MYLITGGAGFIGSNIAVALDAEGADIVISDCIGSDDFKWPAVPLFDRDQDSLSAVGRHQFGADDRGDCIVRALDQIIRLQRFDQPERSSSSNNATRSTLSIAAITMDRACSFCTGLVSPFRRRTEASVLSATTSRSHAARERLSNSTCPGGANRNIRW